MATYVIGFDEERDADFWQSYRHLLRYDPDQIQMLYVTPHRWTPYFETVHERKVIETNTARWDYKHQVLATARVPPWRSRTCLTMARPRPVPWVSRERLLSTR